jgi:hypothetical protein
MQQPFDQNVGTDVEVEHILGGLVVLHACTSNPISTCFCLGFSFHYLSKTRLDHKFYIVKLILNPKVENNLPKFGWGKFHLPPQCCPN